MIELIMGREVMSSISGLDCNKLNTIIKRREKMDNIIGEGCRLMYGSKYNHVMNLKTKNNKTITKIVRESGLSREKVIDIINHIINKERK